MRSKGFMAAAVFYVRLRGASGETSAIYYDRLPAWMTGKHAQQRGLVYAVRLDTLPNGRLLEVASLRQLDALYEQRRAAGTLPAPNIVPQRKAEDRKGRQLGEWWVPPAPSWDPKAPGEPFPDPDSLKARPDAPAATFGRTIA